MKTLKKKGFKSLLQYPEFIKVWMGRLVSRLGDSIDSIAFMWMIYELTGSPLLMGTIMAVNFLPNVLFGLFSGVFVDRWKKKPVMISGDLGRGLCVTIIALLYISGQIEPWHLYIITFLNSTFETFASSARTAIIPRLIKDEEIYLTTNSLFKATSSLAEIIGLGLAGFIIGIFGIGIAILVDAASFFICTIFILAAKIPISEKELTKTKLTRKIFNLDLKEGLQTAFKTPIIRLSILLGVSLNLCISPFNVLAPIYADNVLNGGARAYSFLTLAITIGLLIGSLIIGQIGNKAGYRNLIIIGISLITSGFMGFYIATSVVIALLAAFLIGVGAACISSSVVSLIMKETANEVMGRVSSIMNSLMMAAMPASTALAGLIAKFYNTKVIFLTIGISILLIGLIVSVNKSLKDIQYSQKNTPDAVS